MSPSGHPLRKCRLRLVEDVCWILVWMPRSTAAKDGITGRLFGTEVQRWNGFSLILLVLLFLQDDSNEKTCKLVCLLFFPSLIQKRRIFSVVHY